MSSQGQSHVEATQPVAAATAAPHPTAPHATIADTQLPLIDGYDVLGLVGRGGMGRVFKARHRALDRIVAIKMLLDAGDESLVARFHAEAHAVARLQHSQIAQVFATGQCQGQPFLVLEYLDGGSLAQKLAGKPQAPQDAARLVETLARAVAHSHQHGILHRDLKPGNILLAADGTPKITDFGLAKSLNADAQLTRTGEVVGTPSYMAPEQASGVTAQVGPGADIYALGAILYEALTGRPPFQGPDAMQLLMMVLTTEPVPPSRLLPRLPRDLETICLKCLEKLPRKRYASAALLADDLQRFLDGRPIVARPVRAWERGVKWARRRPAAAAALGLVFLLLVALFIGFVVIQSKNSQLQKSIEATETANQQLASANEHLTKSLQETQDSLQVARTAIDGMLVDLADELGPIPHSDEVRRKALERARVLYERLVAIRPEDTAARSQAADALGKLGSYYHELGRLDDAEAVYRKALAIHRELKQAELDVADHRRGCGNTLLNLANLEQNRGKLVEAEQLARAAITEVAPLLGEQAAPITLRAASNMHNSLALVLRNGKKLDESAAEHQAALALRRQWLAQDPDNRDAKTALAASLVNWSGIQWARMDAPGALESLADAETLLAGQTAAQQRSFLGQIQANRAVFNEMLAKDADAEAAYAAAIKTLTALVADHAVVPSYRFMLAKVHYNWADYSWTRQRLDEARQHLRVAGPILERLVQDYPDHEQFRLQAERTRRLAATLDKAQPGKQP